jgi:PIN domain nuclease of toxin-antitoxin system
LILLDTHVLVWFADGSERLGAQARHLVEAELAAGAAQVSAITFWEVGMLTAKGKLELRLPAEKWSRSLLKMRGFNFMSLEPSIAVASSVLPGDIHGDPADRIIIATARALNCPLLTADRAILDYAAQGHVRAIDASR